MLPPPERRLSRSLTKTSSWDESDNVLDCAASVIKAIHLHFHYALLPAHNNTVINWNIYRYEILITQSIRLRSTHFAKWKCSIWVKKKSGLRWFITSVNYLINYWEIYFFVRFTCWLNYSVNVERYRDHGYSEEMGWKNLLHKIKKCDSRIHYKQCKGNVKRQTCFS